MDKMSDDTLRLRVEDNRLGIEKEKLDSIFDPSVQSEGPAFTQFGGTGIGLFIVQRLVSRMYGTLEVESVYGEGERFNVELLTLDAEGETLVFDIKDSFAVAYVTNPTFVVEPLLASAFRQYYFGKGGRCSNAD